jgi:hypothetical protein
VVSVTIPTAVFSVSRPEPLLFLSSSSSVVLKRLSGTCSKPTTSQKILVVLVCPQQRTVYSLSLLHENGTIVVFVSFPLLVCYNVWMWAMLPTFRKYIMLPSSGSNWIGS